MASTDTTHAAAVADAELSQAGLQWSGLSTHLMAAIGPVDRNGYPVSGAARVIGPVADVQVEVSANWTSPFEGKGAEGLAPMLTSLLQTGQMKEYVDLYNELPDAPGVLKSMADQVGISGDLLRNLRDSAAASAASAAGRAGVTKLNSTQIFVGAAPVKISLEMHFRAFKSPKTEVQAPLDQLARWVLSQEMASSSSLMSAIKNLKAGTSFAEVLLPSRTPQLVSFAYGGQTMTPMVIEGFSFTSSGPRDNQGGLLRASARLQLSTLTALDATDWTRSRAGQATKLSGD